MNYRKFKKEKGLIRRLLNSLEIIEYHQQFIKITNLPDPDFFPYEAGTSADFYFRNFWDFTEDFETVLEAEIDSSRIYTADCLNEISKESGINFTYTDRSIGKLLQSVYQESPKLLEEHGFDTEFDEFQLRALAVFSIDNLEKRLNYEGSFYGSSYEMDSDYWSVYALTTLVTVPLSIQWAWFYKSLVAESYTLLLAHNYKLAFFLLFSALDSFVNDAGGTQPQAGHLKDKLRDLFGHKLGDLTKHQIYSGLAGDFERFKDWRNNIAHGNEYLDLSLENVQDAFVFVLTLMLTYETGAGDFKDLLTHADRHMPADLDLSDLEEEM